MPKQKNVVWRFFASVKFALIILLILATGSIIGTLIKQGQDSAFYLQEYGPSLAPLFEALDFTTMYNSWWFIVLLGLFALNLTVCSIERLPSVWKTMTADNLAIDPRQLAKMSSTHKVESKLSADAAMAQIQTSMTEAGWKKFQRLDQDDFILLFAQKGAWSRLGVYLVHLSILVVLIGVLIGAIFGYQAYVFLPEGKTTKHIFLRETKQPAPLDFELRCDSFDLTYYPNGMVKQYRSDLTVLDPARQAPYQKSIIVNDPLSYGGLTFYQGDAYPLEEYHIVLGNRTTGMEQAFRIPPERDVAWQGTGITFRIEELKRDQDGRVQQARISVRKAGAEASTFWLEHKGATTLSHGGEELAVSFRQLYSTLLLITRDPGVSIVYLGCIMMLAGFAVCFLLSHRRIWVQVTTKAKQGSSVQVGGSTNKNKPGFEQRFEEMAQRIDQALSTSAPKKK